MTRLTPADEHLRSVDHVIRRLIDERGPIDPRTDRRGSRPDPYEALARAVVGQQLSTKAARSIWERLIAPFDGTFPRPSQLLATDPASLRGAGLSRAKVGFLRDLAERIEEGELDLVRIAELSDEDVIAELIAIKGIGRWTAEMFLIFHLGRPDVVSTGDVDLRYARFDTRSGDDITREVASAFDRMLNALRFYALSDDATTGED